MSEQTGKRPFWARRKFLINEHLQLHFIGFAGILSLGACVFFYVASSYFFAKYHGFAVEVGLRPSDPFFRVLYNMEMLLTNIFVGTSVAVVLLSVVGGLLFSHRVAGPMFRMRKHLESVAHGETLGDVNFRQNDYFHEVAEAYNISMRLIRHRLGVEEQAPGENATPSTSISVSEGEVTRATPVNVDAPSSSETVAAHDTKSESDKSTAKKAS